MRASTTTRQALAARLPARLPAGPGELENAHYDAASGIISVHGLSWKVRVPGYGLLWGETGNLVQQCDPHTFENCEVVSNVGHNQYMGQDPAALCDYLKWRRAGSTLSRAATGRPSPCAPERLRAGQLRPPT